MQNARVMTFKDPDVIRNKIVISNDILEYSGNMDSNTNELDIIIHIVTFIKFTGVINSILKPKSS